VTDTHWKLKQETTDIMIPSLEYGKPCDNLEATKYSPIRLPIDLEVITDRPTGTFQTVIPPCRPSFLANTASELPEGLILSHSPSLLVAASIYNKNAKYATFTTSMTLTHNHNLEICPICSAGLNTTLLLCMDCIWVQFCMSYYPHDHCNGACTGH
jgi:hypothetical protein